MKRGDYTTREAKAGEEKRKEEKSGGYESSRAVTLVDGLPPAPSWLQKIGVSDVSNEAT